MQIIAHVFVHNFFVTAAKAEDTSLMGIPFAIAENNRVIDSSYEANSCGVLPGLTKRHAFQACPGLKCFDLDSDSCRKRTVRFAESCYKLTPRVETPALNEAFLNLSGKTPPTPKILRGLAEEIVPHLGSFITISLATCRFLAKAATLEWLFASANRKIPAIAGLTAKKYDKFQLCVVRPENTGDFLSQLPVERIWPLEKGIIKRLKTLGLKTAGDITKIPLTMLSREFASLAPVILDYSHGQDKTRVPVFRSPAEIVYHISCEGADRLQIEEILKKAALHISRALHLRSESYRELTLTVFFEDYRAEAKTCSFTRGKYESRSVYFDSRNLLNKAKLKGTVTEITLAARCLTASKHSQLSLFEEPGSFQSNLPDHKEKLAAVFKNLAARYNPGVITMGSSLSISRREQMLMFVDPLRNQSLT